jgi:type VI secretion system secreted protein Hcp
MADNIVLDIKSIPGESKLKGFEDKIVLMGYSASMSQPMTSDPANTSRTLGRPTVSEIACSKVCDSSSTPLMKACLGGTDLGDVLLHVFRVTSGSDLSHELMMTYTLSNVMISNHSISGSGNDTPYETFSLNFTKISIDYFVQDEKGKKQGTLPASYDMATGQAT